LARRAHTAAFGNVLNLFELPVEATKEKRWVLAVI
jgi:hypothetical protein